MSEWKSKLNADPLPWLLESDEVNPGVRYFALRDLLDRPADDPELIAAQVGFRANGMDVFLSANPAGKAYSEAHEIDGKRCIMR